MIDDICKKLKVQKGKEWLGNDGFHYIIGNDAKLTKVIYLDNLEEDVYLYEDDIKRVLTGRLKPMRLIPKHLQKKSIDSFWKPTCGTKYYIPYCVDNKEQRFTVHVWRGDEWDNLYYKNKLVFRTKEEAIAKASAMMKHLE